MSRSEAEERRAAALVAAGKQSADLVLRGGSVLNVHTGRIGRADVALAGPRVAATGDVDHCLGPATEFLDCAGLTLTPGLIDTHIHLGGSQLSVQRLAEVVVPHGTVAVCTDFYELGTIGGLAAVEGELEASAGTGLDILLSPFFAAVLGLGPFGNLERFSFEDLEVLLNHEACVEIREWNCWAGWLPLPGMQRAYDVALSRGLTVAGHLEGLLGRELQASVALGARSDHEAVTVEQALERVQNGLVVQIREGSGATDFHDLLPALLEHGADASHFSFCTDEQELASMAHEGHIDRLVRAAVKHGIGPIDAVRMATFNAARSIGVEKDYGSISPGRIASIVGVDDLAVFPVRMVVSNGKLAARDGTYLLEPQPYAYPAEAREHIQVNRLVTADDFLFQRGDGNVHARVIGVTPGKLLTADLTESIDLQSGRVVGPSGLAKIAVIDRHEGGENRALALVRGYDLQRGAFASTVNPGMMNLMVVGVDEEDMVVAAQRVIALGGGTVVAVNGEVRAEVSLPLYGIVSDAPTRQVVAATAAIASAIRDGMGSQIEGLLTSAGFACLAVSIPSLKICDRGLVRVARDGQEAVELFVEAPSTIGA